MLSACKDAESMSIDLEVAQVLRRYCGTGDLEPARAGEALSDLADLPITRYPHLPLLPRVWELRHDVTAYDDAYLARAEMLDAPLLTGDVRLATAPNHRARIELL
jgi:predicted nucleic acid-binding protein